MALYLCTHDFQNTDVCLTLRYAVTHRPVAIVTSAKDDVLHSKVMKKLFHYDDVILTGNAVKSIVQYIRSGGAVCLFYERNNVKGVSRVLDEVPDMKVYIVRNHVPYVGRHTWTNNMVRCTDMMMDAAVLTMFRPHVVCVSVANDDRRLRDTTRLYSILYDDSTIPSTQLRVWFVVFVVASVVTYFFGQFVAKSKGGTKFTT